MSSKVVITIFFLVCVGVVLQTTEGSMFLHPSHYRFYSFWPDFFTSENEFFSDPFFRDSDWDPFIDDRFFIDSVPVFRRSTIGNSRKDFLSKPIPTESSVKPSEELKLSVDVKGFAPQELSLVIKGNDVIVKGEKKVCDSTSCYTRSLCWRKKLPREVKMSTVKAKLNKDKTVEITAEKVKKITQIERETQERLMSQNLEKQKQAKASDVSMKNRNSMNPDIPKPVTEKQATKDEVEEETTLEVVNDDE